MLRLPRDFQAFLIAVTLLAVVLFWFYRPFELEVWPQLLLFLTLIAFASMFPIPDPRGGYITATSVLFLVLIVVHGPWAGLLIAGPAYAVGRAAVSRGWLSWRVMFNSAQMGISLWLAGLSFVIVGGSIAQLDIRTAVLPLAVAVLVHQAANNFFVSSYFSRLRGTPWFWAWLNDIRGFFLANFLSIPIALLLSYVYVTVHPLTILLYLFTLPFQRRAYQLQVEQKQIFDQAIDSLVVAIDAGFPQGAGHSRSVANTAIAIGRHLGLSDSQIDTIELGALLHDVGLLGLDEYLGESSLSQDEISQKLRQHVVIGAEISRELPQKGVAEIVLYHHEHFDGAGYLAGLKGNQIPIGARVVALAEAFESMRAGGLPYGHPVPIGEAKEIVIAQSGMRFDPVVVEAFVGALNAGAIHGREGATFLHATSFAEQGSSS